MPGVSFLFGVEPQRPEWQLTEVADVPEVLTWAEERANGKTFVLYAEFVHEGGHGMIRLLGQEPPGV